MAGPSPQFLSSIAPYVTAPENTPAFSPAPAMSVAPPPAPAMSMALPTEAVPAPASPPPPPDPNHNEAMQMSVAPQAAGPSMSVAPPPQPEIPPAYAMNGGEAFPLLRVSGGGMTKAREVDRRGPTVAKAQTARNEFVDRVIGDVGQRSQATAQEEYAMALDQERHARVREAAAQQSVAERNEELSQLQADFASTTKQLAQAGQLDHGRFWASRSTGQKIAAIGELMLAGFRGAPSMVMKRIDDDIEAQKFAYQAMRDTASMKQTAFSMAMQKYNNVDAATAAVRAAALDVVQAQLAQMSAKWRGTEYANRADQAMAALEDEKLAQTTQGVQFIAPQYMGPRWMDPNTGLVYSDAEAKKLEQGRVDRNFKRQEIAANVGGQLLVEGAKADATARTKQAENVVVLPGGRMPDGREVPGETIVAPNAAEAKTIRDLSAAVTSAQQLVAQAKAIRSDPSWVANPEARRRLKQIGAELTLSFKDRGQLGALSGPDMDLAMDATGDLTAMSMGVSDALDRFADVTNSALRNRVRTIAGVPQSAKGEMPASFQRHGK